MDGITRSPLPIVALFGATVLFQGVVYFSNLSVSPPSQPTQAVVVDIVEPTNTVTEEIVLMKEAPVAELTPSSEPTLESENVTYVISRGDTFVSIWQKHGETIATALTAAKALEKIGFKLSSFRAGDKLSLTIIDGRITQLQKKIGDGQLLTLSRLSEGEYSAIIIKPEVLEGERAVSGFIESSFAAGMSRYGVPYEVIDEFVDLFGDRVEFSRDLQLNDRFLVVYKERRTKDGEVLPSPGIVSASLILSGRFYAVFNVDGKTYNESGRAPDNRFLRYPVQYSRISSSFSAARFHPVLKRVKAHNGIDFAAPVGTPVRTIGDGTVIKAGWNGGSGLMVRIRHDNRLTTDYLHLSKIADGVRVGTRIEKGMVIGKVGMTGLATGPHLHFALFDNGRYVDPLKNFELLKAGNSRQTPLAPQLLMARLETVNRIYADAMYASSEFRATRLG